MHKTVLNLDAAVLGTREPMRAAPPEVGAVAPLGRIERIAVELVGPDYLELVAVRQERRRLAVDRRSLRAGDGILLYRIALYLALFGETPRRRFIFRGLFHVFCNLSHFTPLCAGVSHAVRQGT